MNLFLEESAHPTNELEDAVKTLDEFNKLNEQVEEGSLQKTMHLMHDFFAARFSDNKDEIAKKHQDDASKILKAIDVLKSSFIFFEKLLTGSLSQQKLVSSALAVIDRFNTIIEKAHHYNSSLKSRIDAFFAEKNGSLLAKDLGRIHFPPLASIQREFSDKDKTEESLSKKFTLHHHSPSITTSSKKITSLSQIVAPLTPMPHHDLPMLNKQSLELFRMKAIALIEKHELLSNSEARTAVLKAQLHVALEITGSYNAVSCACTLNPFPGQVLHIKGLFEKDPHSTSFSIPNSKSFHLSFISTQTGFPDPRQHTGWALADVVPSFPHQLDSLPYFKPLYERKQTLARQLRTETKFIQYAKQMINLKREAFQKDLEILIPLHRQLCQCMALIAPAEIIPINIEIIFDQFFNRLKHVNVPFDYLSETYGIINETFVLKPLEKLQRAWLDHHSETFSPQTYLENEILQAQQELQIQQKYAQSDLEKCTIDFIIAFGNIIGNGSAAIQLQQLSESMNFAPPALNTFQQKIQGMMYKQLEAFLDDFESNDKFDHNDTMQIVSQKMQGLLQDEINFLKSLLSFSDKSDKTVETIIIELDDYFKKRFKEKVDKN